MGPIPRSREGPNPRAQRRSWNRRGGIRIPNCTSTAFCEWASPYAAVWLPGCAPFASFTRRGLPATRMPSMPFERKRSSGVTTPASKATAITSGFMIEPGVNRYCAGMNPLSA